MNGKETEAVFSLSDDAVRRAFAALRASPDGWRGRPFEVRARSTRTSLHFYLAHTGYLRRRRLRVRYRDGKLAISLESKAVLSEGPLVIEKEETTDQPNVSLDLASQTLSEPAAIVSSFVKTQYRVFLDSASGSLKASIDQMLPFRADRPGLAAPEFWHLEIEETGSWSLQEFLQLSAVRQNLPLSRPLMESKWEGARLGPATSVARMSEDELRAYFRALLDRGPPRYAPWPD